MRPGFSTHWQRSAISLFSRYLPLIPTRRRSLSESLIQLAWPCPRRKSWTRWSMAPTMGEHSLVISCRPGSVILNATQQRSRTQAFNCGRRQVACCLWTDIGKYAERCVFSPLLLRLQSHVTGGRVHMEAQVQHADCAVLSRQVSGAFHHDFLGHGSDWLDGKICKGTRCLPSTPARE